jgi:hypothetical protein
MRAISAVDAISLAVQRTKQFLFQPFRWGTYLKLGLVAIITEGLGTNSHSSSNSGSSSGNAPNYSPFTLHPQWIAAIVAAILLAMLLSALVFYLITRLRFAFFNCLIQNTKELRPGWHFYAEPATRFFWLNIVVGFCYLALVVLIAIPFAAGFWRTFHQIPPGGHPDIPALLIVALPLVPIILLLIMTAIVIDLILRDWMLPHFALENATAGEAWNSVWARIKAEKRQFFVYSLLRLILPALASIGLFFVLAIPGILLAGALAVFGYGLHSAYADATGEFGDCRNRRAGFLRPARSCLRCVGGHLPRRPPQHGNARVCAHLLWRPLPTAGRHTVSTASTP